MTVPKHTPGPWEFCAKLSSSENHRGYYIKSRKFVLAYDVIPVDEDGNEGRANARLIAAAPDMLDALVAAIECGMVPKSSAREGGANAHARQARVADMIRDAIAKATTGETP